MISWKEFRDHAEMLVPPLPWDRPRWHPGGEERVVLLHGLWRGWHAMEPLARHLRSAGYATLNLPYPSARRSVAEIVPYLRREIAKIAKDEPVHFVTHSLGCILIRSLLSEQPAWKQGRVLMLAAPNQGSQIVDWADERPVLRFLLGPSGRTLGSAGLPGRLPSLPAGVEAAVIMGRKGRIPLFRKILDPAHDGIVSVERGKIPGLRGFTVIEADHTFIQCHPEVMRRALAFFEKGEWPD